MLTRLPLVMAAAATLLLAPLDAREQAATESLVVPYTMFKLPNGLTVILHEDHSVPKVAVNVWYHVGSAR